MLMERNLIRVGKEELKTYLNLYANDESISMNETQLKALNKLYQIGYDKGFFEKPIDVNDYLIPTEYNEVRFS